MLVTVLLLVCPRAARAQDLLFIPFLGFTFGGGSSLFADLEGGSGESASAVGGSVALLGERVFGVEADLGYVPGFFERGDRELVVLIWAEARDITSTFPIRSTMPAITLGGGAIGFLSNTVGVRFDLRYIRSLGEGDDRIAGTGARVRFWRGTVGLVLKY
jgi:hypothetical protein